MTKTVKIKPARKLFARTSMGERVKIEIAPISFGSAANTGGLTVRSTSTDRRILRDGASGRILNLPKTKTFVKG